MKKISFMRVASIFSFFLILATISCSKEELQDAAVLNNAQTIKVTGEDVNASTNKTTLDGFNTVWMATSDKVGVYSPEARLTPSGGAGVVNADYAALSSAVTSSFTGTMYWGTGTHHFYAYYPFSAGSAASTVVPISLPTAQTQTGSSSSHVGTTDFMVATPVSTSPGTAGDASAVDFKYNHVFALLEFKIVSASLEVITAVKLTAPSGNNIAFSGGTIDITQTTPGAGVSYTIADTTGHASNKVTLSIPGGVALTNSASTTPSFYMLINPIDLSNKIITISITANDTVRVITYKNGVNFERGKKYTLQQEITVTDVEGYIYNTVTIGTQTWMAENLRTTKYNDGTAITNVTDNTVWKTSTAGAYCWYSNNKATYKTYGALYNWFAVDNNASTKVASNGGKNIAPPGWHVPTTDEWTTLTTYIGENAKRLASTSGWTTSATPSAVGYNQATTNNGSGFSALPGGHREEYYGDFYNMGSSTEWWASTPSVDPVNAWKRLVMNNSGAIPSQAWYNVMGYSVRCVKD